MRELRFSAKAEERLEEIFDWTFERFGPAQAENYLDDLMAKCGAIAAGNALTQNCSILTDDDITTQLRFARSGRHIIVFLDYPEICAIVELLHSSSNLAVAIDRISGSGRA